MSTRKITYCDECEAEITKNNKPILRTPFSKWNADLSFDQTTVDHIDICRPCACKALAKLAYENLKDNPEICSDWILFDRILFDPTAGEKMKLDSTS